MNKHKSNKQAHTADTKYGTGDYYGTGIKQKIGKIRSSYMPVDVEITPKKMKIPPRSLA